MKIITSLLGDRWVINDGKAKPELGAIEFSVNENMMEMLEHAQTSEKWAKRLRTLSTAELNADQDAIFVSDSKNNNWFREIFLDEPCFRVGESDYFNGYDLTWPDDTRLKINQVCACPGSSYGPYLIQCKREDGGLGLVGYCENEGDVLSALEALKNTELKPLPELVEHKNVLLDLPNGYKAEINKHVSYYNDVEHTSYPTAIIYPGNAIAMVATLYPDTLLSMRDDSAFMMNMLEQCDGRRSKQHADELKKLNNRLMNFNKTETCTPGDQLEFAQALKSLKKDTPIKFMTADNEQELLISWKQVKNWRTMDDVIVSDEELLDEDNLKAQGIDAVRLCFEREYTVQVKQADGFLVLEGTGKAINPERLYSIISDPEYLHQAITRTSENGEKFKLFAQEEILETIKGNNKDIDYTSEKTLTLQAAVSKVKAELEKAISSYGF